MLEGDYVIMGDFNTITAYHEKEGGRSKSASSIEGFNNFLNMDGTVDLGFEGCRFTWSNRQYGGNLVREWLNRCLATPNWCEAYPRSAVVHLNDQGSNHRPILLITEEEQKTIKRRFRFQEKWCKEEEVGRIVRERWKEAVQGSLMFQLFSKLKRCRHHLVEWQRSKGGNSLQQINYLKQRIDEEKGKGNQADKHQIIVLEEELAETYLKEERFWWEKTRVQWLNYGDQNTQFFFIQKRISEIDIIEFSS
ncbi:uncharacterized protein LOC127747488 [Arachis duranensis]|uniref:Uncharacterized protein LOC107478520 n=1 Tax=Arachis duranensis TaxID=130453 RepID=A0A6P4CSP8_ARADU|nr:uncharacterized protein LOC107478520 [Arachis duranensis]XP_052117409.1 uncharacterized protein LOC127747488 [Arachis duranensis]